MKEIDPGHEYLLSSYDGQQENRLVFMKREGEGYPFNVGHHAGTNCQEVIRALIARLKYLQSQIPCDENLGALCHLRGALTAFEWRAARRHGRVLYLPSDGPPFCEIEELPTCVTCGHVQCTAHVPPDPIPEADRGSLTRAEFNELRQLQKEYELSSLGDRPHSIAADKLKRLRDLENKVRAFNTSSLETDREKGAHDPRDNGCPCQSCGRRYKVDLMLPDAVWYRINAQNGVACNLLCPLCIAMRLENLGEFDYFHLVKNDRTSAPSVSPPNVEVQEMKRVTDAHLAPKSMDIATGVVDAWANAEAGPLSIPKGRLWALKQSIAEVIRRNRHVRYTSGHSQAPFSDVDAAARKAWDSYRAKVEQGFQWPKDQETTYYALFYAGFAANLTTVGDVVNEAGKVGQLMDLAQASSFTAGVEKAIETVTEIRQVRIQDLHADVEAGRDDDADYMRATLYVLGQVVDTLRALITPGGEK